MQRSGLLHLGQRAHLSQHLGRQLAVDLDQRDGVAAGRFAADMESGDVDASLTKGISAGRSVHRDLRTVSYADQTLNLDGASLSL